MAYYPGQPGWTAEEAIRRGQQSAYQPYYPRPYGRPGGSNYGPGYGGFGEGVPGTGPWGWRNPSEVYGPSGADWYTPETTAPAARGGAAGGSGWPTGGPTSSPHQGGGATDPSLPPWAGQIPAGGWYGMPSALPWGAWGETPWANVPEGRGAEAQQWMNTVLPWYQQQMAWEQFSEQMGWQRERFGQEHGWERERFGEEMAWAQAQQAWQAQQNELQRQLQEQMTNVQTFGRRWAPQTRWF